MLRRDQAPPYLEEFFHLVRELFLLLQDFLVLDILEFLVLHKLLQAEFQLLDLPVLVLLLLIILRLVRFNLFHALLEFRQCL